MFVHEKSRDIYIICYHLGGFFGINIERLFNAIDEVSINYNLQKLLNLDMYFMIKYIEWNFILIKGSKKQQNEK